MREFHCSCLPSHIAEKATEILKEVKGAQEAFRKQKDLHKLEAEVPVHVYAYHV